MFKISFDYNGKKYSEDIVFLYVLENAPKELLWHELGYYITSFLKKENVWNERKEVVNAVLEKDGVRLSSVAKLSGEIKVEF